MNAFIEVWTLLEYMEPSKADRLPEKVKEIIKDEMAANDETVQYVYVFIDGKEDRTKETIYSLRRKSDKQQGTGF
ncbi:MAG: hypothetical protein IKG46_13990 [Solobacterium sp.]|nr:hypothetical protein [Solobacterium sp.]